MNDFADRRTMMVDTQVRPNEVTSYTVLDAMLTVPREEFVPDALRDIAYAGDDLDMGNGRHILEPRTIGRMLETLDLKNSDLVLDVGCGFGYSAALLAQVAEAVVAIESDPEMAAEAQERLAAQNIFNVAVVQATLPEGCPGQAPYDAILISGGSIEVLPDALVEQLRDGGRSVAVFREKQLGTCRIGYKAEGRITWRYAFNALAPSLPGFVREAGFAL